MSGYLLFTLVPEVNTDLTVCLPVGVHDPPQLLPVLSRAGYRVTLHLLFLYAGCAKPCCHQGTELTADAREGAHGHNIRLHCWYSLFQTSHSHAHSSDVQKRFWESSYFLPEIITDGPFVCIWTEVLWVSAAQYDRLYNQRRVLMDAKKFTY